MKAKEKAKELVDRFYNVDVYDVDYGGGGCTCPAKEYALICVDEMIKNIIWSSDFNGSKRKELEEVKQEINKL
tara:strand:- start:3400 stop:3618 length:219 start_codon:yes stop_codon:yes gene_type:complete